MEVALKVNIDFEEVLFRHQPQPHLNASLEFLALWVDPRPLLTKKKYPENYLSYLNTKLGHPPRLKAEGKAILWWGDLSQPEILKEIAQKSFCFNFFRETWGLEGTCPTTWDEVEAILKIHPQGILKSEGKMSGRGNRLVTLADVPALRLKPFDPCVLEPLYERVEDVSALYVSDENKFVFYKNHIDKKFQWRSSLIGENLTISERWQNDLGRLKTKISGMGYLGPFSVDAFFYQRDDSIAFYPGSEVNPRKTMGWVNYKLQVKFNKSVSLFGMEPKVLSPEAWEKLVSLEGVLVLSPPENKFLIYWIGAENLPDLELKRQKFLEQL